MPGAISLKIVGDWRKEIGVPLQDALNVAMHEFGYTGEKACRQCIFFMGQSAGKLTVRGMTRRPVLDNPDFKHLIRKSQYKKMRQEGKDTRYYYKFHAWYLKQDDHPAAKLGGLHRFANQKDRLAKIGNVGLGKRSWMWGFGKGRAIAGVADLYPVSGRGQGESAEEIVHGYVLENRLKYVMQAMPAGWEKQVEISATNRIMGRFRDQIEQQWRREMNLPRGQRGEPGPDAAFLARYFAS